MEPALMQVRLHDVGFPLLTAAADWCPFEQESIYGFLLKDQEVSRSPEEEGTGRRVIASYVHPQLPAAWAGLKLGDHVIEVNANIVTGDSADNTMRLVRRLTMARIQPLQLVVLSEGNRRLLTMWAVPACQFSLRVIKSEQINGVSNGREVAVTTGAMRFFPSDDELAWVLAHEIAHNVLSHVQNAKLRAMLSAFLGATVGTSAVVSEAPPQRSLEAQADYLGSYLMARAGYDLQAVRQVWHRLGRIESQQVNPSREMTLTHPTTAERLAAFDVTLKEIEAKRDRGELLQPLLEKTP